MRSIALSRATVVVLRENIVQCNRNVKQFLVRCKKI